jgi:hypothetical protein
MTESTNGSSNSGSHSRIRAAAACSILDRNTKLAVRQTRRGGYEIYANGDESPTRCETWAEAQTILLGLGIPNHRMDEISGRLVEGKGLVLKRQF